MSWIIGLLAFLLVITALVIVHELGHFLFSKLFGVRVDEFAFGFPPKIWSKKFGETKYAINAIPIGGYVKLLGEDFGEQTKAEQKSARNLTNKSWWQQILILAGGVLFNIIFAWILLTAFYLFGGEPLIPDMWNHPGVERNQKVIVGEVQKDSPAEKSGLAKGDVVVAIGSKNIYTYEELAKAINSNSTGALIFKIERFGKQSEISINTYEETVKTASGKEVKIKRTGFYAESTGGIKSKWYLAPLAAASEVWHISVLTVQGLFDLFRMLILEFKVTDSVGGPVAIYQYSGAAAQMGPTIFIQFMAVLSISLALINILPFPALDGGHILFVLIEKITRRKINAKTKANINKWGFITLIILIILITFRDVIKTGIFEWIKGMFK